MNIWRDGTKGEVYMIYHCTFISIVLFLYCEDFSHVALAETSSSFSYLKEILSEILECRILGIYILFVEF